MNVTSPSDLQKRNSYILDSVRAGNFIVDWVPVTYSDGNSIATFYVTSDALKIDGIRVNVSAMLQQQIADVLDASLLTPRLADLIHVNAEIVVSPMPMAISASVEATIEHSERVDSAIINVVGSLDAARGKLVSTVGKHWVIDAQLATCPQRAVNYGWHVPGLSYKGIRAYPCTIPGSNIGVIQPNATAHTPDHVDYSQTCVLVKRECKVDGSSSTLESVLSDPVLSYTICHQGPLKVLRQPGV